MSNLSVHEIEQRIHEAQSHIGDLRDELPRARVATWGRFVAAHEPTIHYSQVRPTPQYPQGTTRMILDCSGMAETLARWSGLPDPSGLGWGLGNTDSILRHLPKISLSHVRRGDYALWHIGENGLHVATFIEEGNRPVILSHGQEAGPIIVRLANYSHEGTLSFLSAVK